MELRFYIEKMAKIIEKGIDENGEIDTEAVAEKIWVDVISIIAEEHDKEIKEKQKEIDDLEEEVEDLQMEG